MRYLADVTLAPHARPLKAEGSNTFFIAMYVRADNTTSAVQVVVCYACSQWYENRKGLDNFLNSRGKLHFVKKTVLSGSWSYVLCVS